MKLLAALIEFLPGRLFPLGLLPLMLCQLLLPMGDFRQFLFFSGKELAAFLPLLFLSSFLFHKAILAGGVQFQLPLQTPGVLPAIFPLGAQHSDIAFQGMDLAFNIPQLHPALLGLQFLVPHALKEAFPFCVQLFQLPPPGGEHPLGIVQIHFGFLPVLSQFGKGIHPKGDLQHPQLIPQQQKLPGVLGLFLQRSYLAVELGDNVPDAHQIVLGGAEAALGFIAFIAVTGDAGGFLEDFPTLTAFDSQNLVDTALANDGVTLPAQAGIHQEFVHILQPHRFFVDEKLTFPRTVIAAGHGHLIIIQRKAVVSIVHGEGHLTIAQGTAALGAAENHILHPAAPQVTGGLFAQHPADGVHQVGLARAIGSHNSGDPAAEIQPRLIGKGFKALDLKGFQIQCHTPAEILPYSIYCINSWVIFQHSEERKKPDRKKAFRPWRHFTSVL